MLQSLFYKYLERFFPQLQRLIETVNKRRDRNLTYLHKQHLNEEYSLRDSLLDSSEELF